ncbi:MAG: molybdopterin-guanine dinucleotide biosynthesis protein MobB [Cycloclasticus pugetii]|jgi:molybdopterin-guanine dinucleotide biosynthesis protein MobB|uniref:Molybdenum cofactor biosynthesis protein:Molybdopterin-guanine dinucleotide biosynthesis protein n=2 Tax=Cycloclasticus TaxID=34067 RepID=A0AB33Z358_9GAMM|nr:Molybdenum cofactor biosynthesis protein:Molybdopterin-guanine dinucleotide biosynthesis protein [Cycloclasticus pugetii]
MFTYGLMHHTFNHMKNSHTADNSSPPAPILGFVANSGTGKTTLISQLIPILNERGLKTGLIKHSHHDFEIDQPGKDSYRLRKAGASPVVLVSSHRRAVITELDGNEPTLAEQLGCFPPGSVDLVIVEGFKHTFYPKIELHRAELNAPFLYTNDPSIIAIASNTNLSTELPHFDINKPEQIANFIIDQFLKATE